MEDFVSDTLPDGFDRGENGEVRGWARAEGKGQRSVRRSFVAFRGGSLGGKHGETHDDGNEDERRQARSQ